MKNTLLILGIVCIIAAIVGGGLSAFGIVIPLLNSIRRQLLLASFGLVLLAVTLFITATPRATLQREFFPSPSPSATENSPPPSPNPTPTSLPSPSATIANFNSNANRNSNRI